MEGIPALRGLLEAGHQVVSVITLTAEAAARRSGAVDYAALCGEFSVPLHHVGDVNSPSSVELLRELHLDIAFVIGWTQVLRPATLRTVGIGMVGGHASLLPRDRGRAPVNWAIIRGARETGCSLMWLADGVDTGDLIDQRSFPITPYDTCASVYDKVAAANRDMILALAPRLLAGERPGAPQKDSDEPRLPGRRPQDGNVDWSMDNRRVYDFVRALTRPYPGAFSTLDGQRFQLWNAALLPDRLGASLPSPGEVLGPVVSPHEDACGQVVACGTGAVLLLELEDATGHIVRGRALSDCPWTGKVWGHD
jgi:methionyl-tRNA formyltransferase